MGSGKKSSCSTRLPLTNETFNSSKAEVNIKSEKGVKLQVRFICDELLIEHINAAIIYMSLRLANKKFSKLQSHKILRSHQVS